MLVEVHDHEQCRSVSARTIAVRAANRNHSGSFRLVCVPATDSEEFDTDADTDPDPDLSFPSAILRFDILQP